VIRPFESLRAHLSFGSRQATNLPARTPPPSLHRAKCAVDDSWIARLIRDERRQPVHTAFLQTREAPSFIKGEGCPAIDLDGCYDRGFQDAGFLGGGEDDGLFVSRQVIVGSDRLTHVDTKSF